MTSLCLRLIIEGMKQNVSARLEFEKGFKGHLKLKEGEIGIGINDNEAKPYDMLQGALAACLHSTFLDILEKKRIGLDFARYEISGVKRETPPTTLESVVIKVTLPKGHEEALRKSMDLATKYCSVYTTISKVAEMQLELVFE